MILLTANNITKAYGTDVILDSISFHISEGDRIGIIGDNGAGKTTLMNILTGQMAATSGDFFVSPNLTIGYLRQTADFESDNTVMQEAEKTIADLTALADSIEALSGEIAEKAAAGIDTIALLHRLDDMQTAYARRNGYGAHSEVIGILTSMAFSEDFYDKKISTLSGGEKTRLALACLLLKKPDMLILDEPTNHLDIGTLKWLEQYLKSYRGTILLITHDRYFLDQTVNRIFEIENHKLYTYGCSYSAYAAEKRARREAEMRRYEKQQEEIARQEEIIRRFHQHNTEHLVKRAHSREMQLAHLERLEKPEALRGRVRINFKQSFKSGNDVLIGEGLSKGFGHGSERKELFHDVDFDIKRGEKICMVGPNGVGKTTLLKIMMSQLPADGGYLKTGYNVVFGYYDQTQQQLTLGNTVLEEMKEAYRLYSDTEMRSILGRFLFSGEQVFVKVGDLSGGEKARLSLLKTMLTESNVLILDEPTNHLDISSKEVFEDALLEYPGTAIIVSHDRYFLNKIPDRILELSPEGMTAFLGKYDYYNEKKQELGSGKRYLQEMKIKNDGGCWDASAAEDAAVEEPAEGSAQWRRLQKEKEAAERKLQRDKEKLEAQITALEQEIADLESAMCSPQNLSNPKKLLELDETVKEKRCLLDECYETWAAM